MPDCVVYILPVDNSQGNPAGPEIEGTGKELTVTDNTFAVAAVQPFKLEKFTLTFLTPAEFQVTVTVLSPGPPPAVIVPEAETVQT